MKKSLLVLAAAITLLSAYSPVASAIPPRPPGGPGAPGGPIGPIERYLVQGAVRFIGCAPLASQVTIRVLPGTQVIHPSSSSRKADGTIQMGFSKAFFGDPPAGMKLKLVLPSACAGGSVSPAEKVISQFPATAAFTVQMPMQSHRIDLSSAVNLLDLVLNSLEVKLHNYQSSNSFIKIGGQTMPFSLPVARVDLDCGRLCPDLGDGLFYVNDVRLNDAGLSLSGSTLKLRLAFESAGREIKGFHNSLGDNAMPDFEIQNMVINSNPAFNVRADGKMDLMFANVKMSGSVQSTGGCSPFGIDICDAILGTDGKVIKAVETSTSNSLNASMVRNKIADLMASYLASRGINGRIVFYRFSGGYLEIFTR